MSQRDTDGDWRLIAESNPFWGVLSAPEFRGPALDQDTSERFFRSGQVLIDNIFAFVRQHLHPEFAPGRSLDFGCGVGRLLLPIARRSGQAVGVDVAPRMLELCRANATAAAIDNVALLLADDELTGLEGPFEFVNSYIVLQHIPPDRGLRLLARLLAMTAQGGVVSIQLTYGKARRFLAHEAPRAAFYRRDGSALHDLVPSPTEPPAGSITMYDYDLNQVFALVQQVAGTPMAVLPTGDDDHLGLHLLFRRAAA